MCLWRKLFAASNICCRTIIPAHSKHLGKKHFHSEVEYTKLCRVQAVPFWKDAHPEVVELPLKALSFSEVLN